MIFFSLKYFAILYSLTSNDPEDRTVNRYNNFDTILYTEEFRL